MDNKTFWYICNNQRKLSEEYRTQQIIRKEIRKIINRKFLRRNEFKVNILNDLKSSLYADELTITEDLANKVFEVRWRGECYSIPAEERM